MADGSHRPRVCGWRKKDMGVKEARLVALVENLNKDDNVHVIYPQSRAHPYLKIDVNGRTVKEKYIPDDVVVKECKSKVRHKRKDSEIKITLRKERTGLWENRWSPSHDGLHGNPMFPVVPSSSEVSVAAFSDSASTDSRETPAICGAPQRKKKNRKRGEGGGDAEDGAVESGSSSSSSESESDSEGEIVYDAK